MKIKISKGITALIVVVMFGVTLIGGIILRSNSRDTKPLYQLYAESKDSQYSLVVKKDTLAIKAYNGYYSQVYQSKITPDMPDTTKARYQHGAEILFQREIENFNKWRLAAMLEEMVGKYRGNRRIMDKYGIVLSKTESREVK